MQCKDLCLSNPIQSSTLHNTDRLHVQDGTMAQVWTPPGEAVGQLQSIDVRTIGSMLSCTRWPVHKPKSGGGLHWYHMIVCDGATVHINQCPGVIYICLACRICSHTVC